MTGRTGAQIATAIRAATVNGAATLRAIPDRMSRSSLDGSSSPCRKPAPTVSRPPIRLVAPSPGRSSGSKPRFTLMGVVSHRHGLDGARTPTAAGQAFGETVDHHLAVSDHQRDVTKRRDVIERIARYGDDVGGLAGHNRAGTGRHSTQLCGPPR